jgi:hypothetical protein
MGITFNFQINESLWAISFSTVSGHKVIISDEDVQQNSIITLSFWVVYCGL